MGRYREPKTSGLPDMERDVLAWWEAHDTFHHSVATRRDAPSFTFYEGPPTANGHPGIHHVMARTIKDVFCRYKTMRGFRVERKGGWDTHGLPVEIEVEKELGLSGRDQVLSYGIEKYNAACRESVLRYKDEWDTLTKRMAYWVDLDNPYVTFDPKYIETAWWLIRQIHERGLLYKGHKIQWYSPGSGTVLSSHEVSLGYEEVQDPSVTIRFRMRDQPNTFFLAWTTTPWTLISNVALAVGDEIEYVRVVGHNDAGEEERLILARNRLEVVGDGYVEEASMSGADLAGLFYEPLFTYLEADVPAGSGFKVIVADYVSTEDGTGIVHTAPAFGAEDFDSSRRHGLPVLNPIHPDGTFEERIALVKGMWFKDADRPIVRDLRDRGLLFKHETYLHNYPHDWRKGTPLMSYPVESWFVKTTAVKERLIALNDKINWQPPGIGVGRFGEWLRNNVDWALSRRRFWGTPLPIWTSDAPGSEYYEVIGSFAELREKCGGLPQDFDPHRPYVDTLTWPAPDGGTMRRVEDLIDVWFDSGAMPFAQWHYPFENKENFDKNFPADFIAEGVDQTRGWFYTLHAIATIVMDDLAYRNVVVNGLVLDEKGEKMSKSRGNAVDPFHVIDEYGADVVRWYMMSNAPPWENIKFSDRGLKETRRKFFGTLENLYGFFATYANIDGFEYGGEIVPVSARPELDRWIISRLNSTSAEVGEALESYNPTRAARAVERFIDEFSNWHIRRSRRRFWKESDDGHDKLAAYQTVHECLVTVAKLISPVAPFFSEWLYQALTSTNGGFTKKDTSDRQQRDRDRSVHLSDFPDAPSELIDPSLERRMQTARTIVSTVLSLRNQCGINVRQPLPKIIVVTGPAATEAEIESVRLIVLEEVNVKDIEYIETSSGIVKRSAKPNYKLLGKRLGKLMRPVAKAVSALSDARIEDYIETGELHLSINGDAVTLGRDELEISSEGIEGWLVGQEDGITVALDVTISTTLRLEGLARETVNRIQNLRKKAGFEVTDRIKIVYSASSILGEAIRDHEMWIRDETLALELVGADIPEGEVVESFDLEEERLIVGLTKLTN